MEVMKLEEICLSFGRRRLFATNCPKRVLDRVSFSVYQGETLGILGKNGCGKSSLLKILAGILVPDSGSLTMAPDIQVSLQSIAAGFDAELSGHDNAILSAILVGRSKAEAQESLEEVKAFSELGDSFFEPVKSYSSGMRARLGFAIGLTAKADVLLIDEALGVGDERFREKAEHELNSRLLSSQTYVLVSHSLPQIERLCDRAIWLEDGAVKDTGEPAQITEAYRTSILGESA